MNAERTAMSLLTDAPRWLQVLLILWTVAGVILAGLTVVLRPQHVDVRSESAPAPPEGKPSVAPCDVPPQGQKPRPASQLAPVKAQKSPRKPSQEATGSVVIQQHSEGPNSPNVVGHNNQITFASEPLERQLSGDQVEHLTRVLSAYAPQKFGIVIATELRDPHTEQATFARQLEAVLVAAGWVKTQKYTERGDSPSSEPRERSLPLYTPKTERGVTILASQGSGNVAGNVLSTELRKMQLRSSAGYDESILDFVAVFVGLQ